jgi:hypothetical protein
MSPALIEMSWAVEGGAGNAKRRGIQRGILSLVDRTFEGQIETQCQCLSFGQVRYVQQRRTSHSWKGGSVPVGGFPPNSWEVRLPVMSLKRLCK